MIGGCARLLLLRFVGRYRDVLETVLAPRLDMARGRVRQPKGIALVTVRQPVRIGRRQCTALRCADDARCCQCSEEREAKQPRGNLRGMTEQTHLSKTCRCGTR